MNSTIKEYTSDPWQQSLQSVDSGSVKETWESINVNFKIASSNTVQRVAPNEEPSSLNIYLGYIVPYKFGCHFELYNYYFFILRLPCIVWKSSFIMIHTFVLCFLHPLLRFYLNLLCFIRHLLCFLRPSLCFLRFFMLPSSFVMHSSPLLCFIHRLLFLLHHLLCFFAFCCASFVLCYAYFDFLCFLRPLL